MLILRCTAKLLKELGAPKSNIYDFLQSDTLLGSWYANIIFINRRKSLLFVNEKTLFTFLIPGIKKSDLKNIKEMFLENLRLNLIYSGIKQATIEKIYESYVKLVLSKTINKSVLGSMNDYARCYKYVIYYEDGTLTGDILQINSKMNKMPMGAIGDANGEKMLLNLL